MKLYGLYIVETSDSIMRLMAASNEVEKLTDVTFTPDYTWMVQSSKLSKLVKHTTDNVYPKYVIYEIPYVV